MSQPAAGQHGLIGLMSGTSLDGVDGVLATMADDGSALQVRSHAHRPMPAGLRSELLALNQSGPDELRRAALAANALARLQAEVVADVLADAALPASAVRAIGSHGQTVRHQPGADDGTGYTWQLNQPALLAELTGIDVVADFRSRDLAAGGQGAPLVPAFHAQVFGRAGQARALLNLGGIGNLTLLPGDGQVLGFDCGPGNALLDGWVARHRGQPFDADGAWGAQGQVLPALLDTLMAEPFLALPPPKSTGRDLFHADWLAQQLRWAGANGAQPVDVQATLTAFTVQAAAEALRRHAPRTTELLVCGGGALNGALMRRLAEALPDCQVRSTAAVGLPPMQVEAAAFAWLAQAHLARRPGNLAAVTGARGPRVLGALYPA